MMDTRTLNEYLREIIDLYSSDYVPKEYKGLLIALYNQMYTMTENTEQEIYNNEKNL